MNKTNLDLEQLTKDAARYQYIFSGNKVYSQFMAAYHLWDGSGGKEGFDTVIDEIMKEQTQ